MNKATKIILAIVFIAIIAGVAVWAMNKNSNDNNTKTNSSTNSTANGESNQAPQNQEAAVTITYTGDGFELSATTMKVGQSVKVVNNSQKTLDFDSDPHPVHTDNTELNIGDIAAGESKIFKIDKAGTWGFHNHLSSREHGKITVQ